MKTMTPQEEALKWINRWSYELELMSEDQPHLETIRLALEKGADKAPSSVDCGEVDRALTWFESALASLEFNSVINSGCGQNDSKELTDCRHALTTAIDALTRSQDKENPAEAGFPRKNEIHSPLDKDYKTTSSGNRQEDNAPVVGLREAIAWEKTYIPIANDAQDHLDVLATAAKRYLALTEGNEDARK